MDFKIIPNLLSDMECAAFIDLSEDAGYTPADISYPTGPLMKPEYRNNYRALFQNEEIREYLYNLILPHAPAERNFIKEGGVVEKKKLTSLSGNFRFYKYLPGNYFKKHRDTNTVESDGIALVTVLIYLNDVEDGGETNLCDRILEKPVLVKCQAGTCLLFDHSILHEGLILNKGLKYVLRTDLIYK